jgi:hypothetical protein
MATIVSHATESSVDCGFNAATLHPDNPIKCHLEHAENTGTQRRNSIS